LGIQSRQYKYHTEGKREEEGAVYEEDAGGLSLSRARASASTLVARRSLEDEGDNDEEMEDAESEEELEKLTGLVLSSSMTDNRRKIQKT
jgi:hypothetical protein